MANTCDYKIFMCMDENNFEDWQLAYICIFYPMVSKLPRGLDSKEHVVRTLPAPTKRRSNSPDTLHSMIYARLEIMFLCRSADLSLVSYNLFKVSVLPFPPSLRGSMWLDDVYLGKNF